MDPSSIPYFGILPGTTAASRVLANSIYSILTRVGYCVDFIDSTHPLAGHDAVIATSARMLNDHRVVRKKCLLFDADRLESPVTSPRAGKQDSTAFVLDGVTLELNGRVRGEEPATANILKRDDRDVPISFRRSDGLIEGLPLFLTPDIQRPEAFWQLGRLLAESIAELLGRREFRYFEPWPSGYRSALAITLDLDAMAARDERFDRLLRSAPNPCTLFACADQVQFLNGDTPHVEIACHGDVHVPFDDPSRNWTRVEEMCRSFNRVELQPAGFSPPNLVYTSPVQNLMARFRYVRMGYMEKELLFYPQRFGGGVLIPVSFYPDHALKYVAPETFAAMTDTFLAWSRELGGLSVLCFHPTLYPGAFEPYLHRRHDGEWAVTLRELSRWWNRRRQAILDCRATGRHDGPEELPLSSELADYRDRLDRLNSLSGSIPWGASSRDSRTHIPANAVSNLIVIDNTLGPARRNVQAEVPPPFWGLRFCPRRVAERILRTGIRIDAKNGFHACFYGNLGLKAEYQINGSWNLRIPFLAANELLIIRKPKSRLRSHLGGATARLRKLAAAAFRRQSTPDANAHVAR